MWVLEIAGLSNFYIKLSNSRDFGTKCSAQVCSRIGVRAGFAVNHSFSAKTILSGVSAQFHLLVYLS